MPCAKIDIGFRDDRLGCMSYFFLKRNEIMIHGIDLISLMYPNFDAEGLVDKDTGEYYNFEMIMNSFYKIITDKGKIMPIEFCLYFMMIFDMLIGNTDRHQQNWGLVYNAEKKL